jgi:hypothetical protein
LKKPSSFDSYETALTHAIHLKKSILTQLIWKSRSSYSTRSKKPFSFNSDEKAVLPTQLIWKSRCHFNSYKKALLTQSIWKSPFPFQLIWKSRSHSSQLK